MTPPLRIVLDATPLSVRSGGIRRYTAELARALAQSYPEDSYFLVSDQPFELPFEQTNLHTLPAPITLSDRRWWTLGVTRAMIRLGADVFHGTDFSVPYLPIRPAVMTVHDLSPFRPDTAGQTSPRIRRRTPRLLKLGLATMVITPSEAIRREAIAHFGLHPERVVTTPLAASDCFRPVAPVLRERPYFLCAGSTQPRKNIAVVQSAWRELRNKANVDLVVMDGEIDEQDLPALYSGALAYLYPSLYEGFGLPVLEAMQCGTMVIASKDPAVSEVAGGAAIQVEASDERGWLAAMREALSPEHRISWRQRGLARAARFSWTRTAKLTREVYDQARRRF